MQLTSGTKRPVRPRVPTITAKYSIRCPNGTYRRLDAKSELNKRVLDLSIPIRRAAHAHAANYDEPNTTGTPN